MFLGLYGLPVNWRRIIAVECVGCACEIREGVGEGGGEGGGEGDKPAGQTTNRLLQPVHSVPCYPLLHLLFYYPSTIYFLYDSYSLLLTLTDSYRYRHLLPLLFLGGESFSANARGMSLCIEEGGLLSSGGTHIGGGGECDGSVGQRRGPSG